MTAIEPATNQQQSSGLKDAPKLHSIWAAANLLIVGLWFRLFWPLLPYFSIIFEREDFRLNQILLVIILALFTLQIRSHGMQINLSAPPRSAPLPLLLFAGGCIAFTLAERTLSINTLSALLFVLSGYGLLGLWMEAGPWRRRLPAALMLLGVLPFGEHLQTFVGFPMRMLTARLVGSFVQFFGVPSVGIDTILVFENGISQVDLPCSGVKSLWTGALFLVSATWIEQRAMTIRWWLVALTMPILLFFANFVRVLLLVVIGEVGGFTLFAEMIHVPLGVLGFIIVCAIVLLGLQLGKKTEGKAEAEVVERDSSSWRLWLSPVLVVGLGALILLYTPLPATGSAEVVQPWLFSNRLVTEPLPLKQDEAAWFIKDGAESVDRVRFTWHDESGQEISGTMILVTSSTWRAHHNPERCFEVYGLTLNLSQTHLTAQQQPIRSVQLGHGTGKNQYAATYWFQSANQITDDYGVRIWADTKLDRQRWVLVSILFDEMHKLSEPTVETLVQELQQTVGKRLRG